MPKAIIQGVKQTGENWRDNYITPPYLLDAMHQFSTIFHDPFTANGPRVQDVDWANYKGCVLWCNPPFSQYMEFYKLVRRAPVPQVWITAHDHSTERFKTMMQDAWRVCLLNRRVRFIDPRTGLEAGNPSDCHTLILTSWDSSGREASSMFEKVFGKLGMVLKVL